MRRQSPLASGPQSRRSRSDDAACTLRHTGRRGAVARGIREHMQMRDAAVCDDVERTLEHRVILCREPGDDVRPEHHTRAQPAHVGAEADRIIAAVPPLHAFQDEIITRLQRQMQMRHQAPLTGNCVAQGLIHLDRIQR